MHSIQQLQNIINKAIADTKYAEKPVELYEPISYLMELGGKRMRPVLVLVSTELFGGDVYKALDAAIGIELFHNFTLMHDDIMDKAPLRRGKPTVHVKWSENVAILSGDVMFVEAYKMMIKVEDQILREVLDIFSATASGVCQGQQADMNFELREEVSIEEYLHMIKQKTAVLLAGSMQIGALIGGAEQSQSRLIYEFGENLGLAFQLQDDILDVYGDPEKFGKQVGGDILANKKTFLLIKAKELAIQNKSADIGKWLNGTSYDAAEKIKAITSIYDNFGVRKLAELQMEEFVMMALAALDKIPAKNDTKALLKSFAESLLVREH
ncbi:MAG: polyprenyl synthetase family protein [Phormidesmis sp. FL-bin-119]|nr:polyprenyl synthetase family protein [Pedobacter sp.]